MKILVSSKPSSFQAVPTKVTNLLHGNSEVLILNRNRPSFLPVSGSLVSHFLDCFLLLLGLLPHM